MSKSWSHRADLFRTSFSLVGCDLLQSRGRARRFLSWQEQPSPNSNYTDTLVNDIRGLRLDKDAWSGFCPTPSFRPSGRPRKPAWRLWPGRQAFGFDRRATKRSFWDDLAGNRPLVEDLAVCGKTGKFELLPFRYGALCWWFSRLARHKRLFLVSLRSSPMRQPISGCVS